MIEYINIKRANIALLSNNCCDCYLKDQSRPLARRCLCSVEHLLGLRCL